MACPSVTQPGGFVRLTAVPMKFPKPLPLAEAHTVPPPMSSSSDIIRKLLLAHFKGDETAFRAIAWDLVERERRLNHRILANELERILSDANAPAPAMKAFISAMTPSNGNLPKDKDRNASLVNLSEPQRELDDLVLSGPVGTSLDRIIRERRESDVLKSHGLPPMGKFLFCGPPGCGKTVAAEAIAKELYLPLATVRFDAVVSSYLGETAANLRKVFDFARLRPMVLFFDEFDAIGKHRSAFDEHGELKRVVNSFLQLLDSFHADTLTIAATNHQGLLDSALWRRFDDIIFFPQPTAAQIEDLLARQFRQLPLSQAVRLRTVAGSLQGMSFADVERLAHDAKKECVLSGSNQVTPATLEAAIDRQRRRMEVTDLANCPTVPATPKKRRR
jgi:SpoVK/Ycf46/Vps4 family AAA+-type ATPase